MQQQVNVNLYQDQHLKIQIPAQRQTPNPLPEIQFLLSQQQIDSIYDIIVEPEQNEKLDVKIDIEHYKTAMWLLHKLFIQRGLSLKQISMRNQYGLLHKLNVCLKTENPEMMLATLRTLLAFLQKFDSQDIPIKDIKEIGLIETLHDCLDHENELLGELTRLSLSILTQMSYNYPSDVAKFNIKKVIQLCDSSCGDLKTQESAIKLICNLLTNEISREEVMKNDGLFGIFHSLINNNKAALKYALASILNLTFLTNSKSSNIIQQIAFNGGIAHLIGALQKSSTLVDYQSMIYAIKSISNMAMSSININLVIGEFGTFDILIQILKSQSQIQTENDDQMQNINQIMSHCIVCLQSISLLNLNKIQLIDKTTFLLIAQQLISNHQTDQNSIKALVQTLGQIAAESYQFSRKIQSAQGGALMQEVYKLMMRSKDEGVIRKCMRFYIQMANSGASLDGIITSNEIQQFNEEKRPLLSIRGEKLLSKLQTSFLKPTQQKKSMNTNEEQLDWDEINKIRKATKGCLTILKDKINSQFEKKKEFDMSFGLGKDHDDEDDDERQDKKGYQKEDTQKNKFQQYRDELNKKANVLIQKREETLQTINRNDSMRKSRTPQRLNNPKSSMQQNEIQTFSKNTLTEKTQRADNNKSVIQPSHDKLFSQTENKSQSLNQSYRHQTPVPPKRPNSKLSTTRPSVDNTVNQIQAKERFNMLEPLSYIPQVKNEAPSKLIHDQDIKNATMDSFNSYTFPENKQAQNQNQEIPQSKLQVKGGPLSIHSLNSVGMESRLNSRQSQTKPNAHMFQLMHQNSQRSQFSNTSNGNINNNQQQIILLKNQQLQQQYQGNNTFEPSQITEESKQPTFDSYYQDPKAVQNPNNNRIDPFQNKAYPNQDLLNQQQRQQINQSQQKGQNDQSNKGYATFAQTFLPTKRREEIDIEEQVRQFKSGKAPDLTGNFSQQNQPPNAQRPQAIIQSSASKQVGSYPQQQQQQYHNKNPFQQDVSASQNQVKLAIPRTNEQMVLENQAKIQMLDKKAIIPPHIQNQLAQQQQSLVPYQQTNQQYQAQQQQYQQQVSFPTLPRIDLDKYVGMEQPLIERFLDVNLLEKDSLESKQARHHLGIGMPEIRALQKKNNITTVRELIEWYLQFKNVNGEGETHQELQRSICSSQLTVKIIALIILTAQAMGYNLN